MIDNIDLLYIYYLQKCGVFDKQLWSALYPKIHTTVSICFLFVLPLILCLIFYMSLSCVVCAKKQREGKS